MDGHPLFRKRALEKLQAPEQLDQLLTVTSPRSWLALLAITALLTAGLLWSVLATVEVALPGTGVLRPAEADASQLEAILFVTLEDAQRIRRGMKARISPAMVRQEEHGLLHGWVTAVGRQPATFADMSQVVGNDAFAQFLVADGRLVEVRVALIPDPATPSGYAWTSVVGPSYGLQAGSVANGSVVVSQQKPIDLLLPSALRQLNR